MASSPSSTEPTASTVVFSLAHLRDSIFAFHASAIKQRRQDVLGEAEAARSEPGGHTHYLDVAHPQVASHGRLRCHFGATSRIIASIIECKTSSRVSCSMTPVAAARRRSHLRAVDLRRVQTTTSILQLMRKLGLKPAAWVDYCLDRPRDLNAWLTTYSNCDAELAKAFQPHPHSVHRSGGRHDEPLANPMEMLMYSVVRQHYVVGEHPPQSALVSQQYLMCDEDGSTFVLRIVDRDVEPFFHQAVEKCPDLLFSETSPFFPLHDFVSYTNDDRFGLIVSSTPPAPFSRHLDFINIHAGDELRRILERGRDVYWHLAQLEKYGISMDGQTPMDGWQLSLVFAHWGPWLLPSYLRPSSQRGRGDRFTRTCHVAEELPEPPASAWPLPFYSCKGAVVRSIPWSQSAAFHDPRVRGPTTVTTPAIGNVLIPRLLTSRLRSRTVSPWRRYRQLARRRRLGATRKEPQGRAKEGNRSTPQHRAVKQVPQRLDHDVTGGA